MNLMIKNCNVKIAGLGPKRGNSDFESGDVKEAGSVPMYLYSDNSIQLCWIGN
jgi:hypothetical protein